MSTNETRKFNFEEELKEDIRKVLSSVNEALLEKGYQPVNQIVGYLLSGDPTYITSHNNARQLMKKYETDQILEVVLKSYLENEV